ncbi:MAG: phage head closure protein [Lachnospiraceae bacterium]|nr:phage head closure protein [Lachnospiraceae bacterium]
MNIGLLNERVCFQKNTVVVDDIGNHSHEWADFYECACTIGGESLKKMEQDEEAVTLDVSEMTVTIRYCLIASVINTKEFRVRFHDDIYNIIAVDHMNFKKQALKFRCRKETYDNDTTE